MVYLEFPVAKFKTSTNGVENLQDEAEELLGKLNTNINAVANLPEDAEAVQLADTPGWGREQTPIPVAGAGGSINARLVLTISVAVGLYVHRFGYEYVQGNPVPTTAIFKGSPPSMFYAFVACIVFAFTGSFNALMLQNNRRSDKLCRLFSLFSVLFLASAFLILLSQGVLLMGN